jgi:excisionase family DNA binding protein
MTEVEAATEQRLASVPSLDDIARDPECAGGLPVRTLAALQGRAAAVLAALAAAALAATSEAHQVRKARAGDELHLLAASEVAELLGTSKAVVYEMARRKKIGSVCASIGSRGVRFTRAQVEAFISSRSRSAAGSSSRST